MNDIEPEVFSRLAAELRKQFPDVNVVSEYVHEPSRFPHVSIVMSDNIPMSRFMTNSDSNENEISNVSFEINVYSNLVNGKKSQCKSIMKLIDDVLYKMNFKRQSMMQLPNTEQSSLYRINARYRVVTDGKYFYRR